MAPPRASARLQAQRLPGAGLDIDTDNDTRNGTQSARQDSNGPGSTGGGREKKGQFTFTLGALITAGENDGRRLGPSMLALAAFAAHGLASSGGLAAQTAAWELHAQGKMMEAIQQMKAAVATAPPEAITPRFDLACMWEDIGYLDEAEEGFKGLAAEHDGWKTYWANVLHDGRGLREQALALYREASAASATYKEQGRSVAFHTNALYGRGVCAESLGLVDEAADCHRRCLQLDPSDASAAFHLLVNSERRSGSTCDALREELAQLLPTYRLSSWDYVQRHPRLAPSTHLYTHGLLHRALDALDPTLDDGRVLELGTLHPAPCTLHPAPCTLHPAPDPGPDPNPNPNAQASSLSSASTLARRCA